MTKPIYVFSLFPYDNGMKTGGQARLKALLTNLKEQFPNVFHVCVFGDSEKIKTRIILNGISETWIPDLKKSNTEILKKQFENFSGETAVGYYLEKNKFLQEYIFEQIPENCILIANHFWFGNILSLKKWGKSFLFSHNFESDFIKSENHTKKFFDFYLEQECKLSNGFDSIVVCSNNDLNSYVNHTNKSDNQIIVCPNGSSIKIEPVSSQKTEKKECIFIGSHWPNNVEGINKFIHKCPIIIKNYKVNMVGSINKAYHHISHSNLAFHGILEEGEIIEIAESCSFAINPVFSGGGSNVKNADYIALGLPILTTHFGSRGFEDFKEHMICGRIEHWDRIIQSSHSFKRKTSFETHWSYTLFKFLSILKNS